MTRRVGTTHCEMETREGRRPSWTTTTKAVPAQG